jgi:2-oxopent-4-enoate/cis-2-oxohex-4-enoate hydratase
MGSPAEAVAWLVRSLYTEGLHLAAGDLVFTGGLAAPFDVESGDHFAVHGRPLASVELRVGAAPDPPG